MPGTGIWLPDDTYLQTQGQLWMQGQQQAIHGQVQAGQQWAAQQMQRLQQQAQAQVQAMAQPAAPSPAPVAPPPTPAPVQVAPPTPAPTPAAAPPAAAPAQTPPAVGTTPVSVPTPPPAPAPTSQPQPTTDMLNAGQDWANQQIQNLIQPSTAPTAAPQPTPAPQPAPAVPTTPTPSAAPPSATTAAPAPSSATAGTGAIPAGPRSSAPGDLIDQARQAAVQYGIDPEIFTRQIQQESGFNPTAKSGAGAIGIAQIMPDTAKAWGVDPTNAGASLLAAAKADAQNLQKYGGDWAKTLAAYNAGGGNVDKYGGVPPFAETQNYVKDILGGAQKVVQQVGDTVASAVNAGQTAVNTAAQGVQAAAARVSQFAMGLSSGDAMAFCGPAAAMAFAQTYGRNPTVDEAKQLAQQVGWNAGQGMAGVGSEVKLLNAMGVDAHATQGVDWSAVGRDAQGGNPVIIDTPGHYYYVDGYNAQTGQFHVGTSGTDLKGGSEWMTSDQINQMPQSDGAARAAVFADHPLAGQPGLAQSTAAQTTQVPPSANQPTYMTTMQPADINTLQPGNPAQDLLNAGLRQAQNVSSAVQSKAQDVLSAVQNVGGQALNTLSQAPGAISDWQQQQQQLGQQYGYNVGQRLDLTKPLGPQLGIDPYGQIVQQGIPNILQGVQTGNLGGILGGALQTGLGVLSAVPGAGGAEAAAAPALEQIAPSAVPWSERSLAALNAGPSTTETALPGVLQSIDQAAQARALGMSPDLLAGNFDQLGRRIPSGMIENPLTSAELGQPSWDQYGVLQRQPAMYSDRGIAIDPVTGQEMLPSEPPPGITPNSWAVAAAANPGATLMRTAGNQFEPVIAQAPMASSDVLTGLQNMVGSRNQQLIDTLQQLTQKVEQATAPEASSADVQSQLQPQVDSLIQRVRDLGGDEGSIDAALARALGGGAAGGLLAYQTTDPNDPNRWLKVAGAAAGGALALGPGLEPLTAGVPSQTQLEQVRQANLNPNVYQPTTRPGILPQVADVTKQLILSNPATHVGNLIGNTLEILRSPIGLTLGGRPQDAIAGMTAVGQAIPEAARSAWAALNGQQVATLGTAASQIPLSQPVYRVLGAVDTFTRTLGEYQGMAERASQILSRAGVSPNDPAAAGVLQANAQDLVNAARAQGARSVFQPVRDVTQGTTFLDNLAHTYAQYKEGLLNSPNLGSQALGTLLDFELPFAGIPMKLLQVGAARTPGIAQVTGIGRALAAARAGDLPAMQRAIGDTVLETGIQAMIAKGISDGNIVGPDNPDHPGGAIQVGGQWFNFDRMAGGFALPMQIMAGFAEAFNKAGIDYISPYANQAVGVGPAQLNRGALDRLAQQTAAGLNAAMKPFASAVPGQALMNMLVAVGDGGTSQLIQQQAQDAIARVSQPGFARFMENMTDPVAREIQKAGPDALWQPSAAAIPGLSALVPPKIDPTTGQPMPRTSVGLGQLIGAENPHLSAITQEANALRMKYGFQVNPPRAYPNQITVGNSVIPLSPAEQQAVVQLSGQRMAQLAARIESPQYSGLPPLQRAMMIQGISRAADQLNTAALEQVLGPQEFRARVMQGLQLAGAPMMAQPQIFGQSTVASPMLQGALWQALQPSAGGLQGLTAANQAAANYNAQPAA